MNSQQITDLMTNLFQSFKTEIKEEINSQINKLSEKIESSVIKHEEIISNHDKQIENIEREVRKRNILIHGLEEISDNYFKTETQILSLLRNKLNVDIEIEELDFVRRLGKKSDGKIRPIILGLATYRKKIIILKNKNKLKNTNVYITEDFPPKVMEKRRELQTQLMDARKEGKLAYLAYDKLIIREKEMINPKKRAIDSPGPPKNGNDKHNTETKKAKVQSRIRSNSLPRNKDKSDIKTYLIDRTDTDKVNQDVNK